MKIVIQCAAKKNANQAGTGFRTNDGRLVKFVAHPERILVSEKYIYARPDDLWNGSQTWRKRLLDYNGDSSNPLHLMPAYRLYKDKSYENLVTKFGPEQVFILSAGWGLISANFLTPDYDITFSRAKNVAAHCKRSERDHFIDICQLPDDGDNILFFGGKDYLPLFCRLTSSLKAVKKVFFNSNVEPMLGPRFYSAKFLTTQRTNWHYSCAQALIDGRIGI